MGIAESQMPVWDPDALELGGNTPEAIADAKVILWQGFCNVHMKFLPEHVDNIRKLYPGIRVIVHPESKREVVEKSDAAGSTGAIISAIQGAAPGSRWAIGTEASLVETPEDRASRAGDPPPVARPEHLLDDEKDHALATLSGAGTPGCGRSDEHRLGR